MDWNRFFLIMLIMQNPMRLTPKISEGYKDLFAGQVRAQNYK